jgi:hypothetical protein
MQRFNVNDVKKDSRFSENNTIQILRVCDVYAKALSLMKNAGYPEFKNYWKQKDRDKAIGKIRGILSKNILLEKELN